jgi:prepilin-type N-terminal cleavage/methylation domain-containing protein
VERRQAGFSLVEMLVALTVSLLATGAIYQLVTAGQSAFRREPALADRQQNIRAAMDIISQDVLRAGFGLPEFVQVFTQNLDHVGPLMGASGLQSDMLELVEAGSCPSLEICSATDTLVVTREAKPACFVTPGKLLFANTKEWQLVPIKAFDASVTGTCSGATTNGILEPLDGDLLTTWFATRPDWVMNGAQVRYRINNDASNVPNLERSTNAADPTPTWEIVARGIDDLQVQYRRGTGGWVDDPGLVAADLATDPNGTSLVWRVRLDLSARVVGAPLLAGQTTSAVDVAGVSNVRGRLVTEIAPRAAQAFVAVANHEE